MTTEVLQFSGTQPLRRERLTISVIEGANTSRQDFTNHDLKHPPKKQQQANKQKQKQKNIYLTTRLAAVEHLLQLCQKNKTNRKSISFYSIAV